LIGVLPGRAVILLTQNLRLMPVLNIKERGRLSWKPLVASKVINFLFRSCCVDGVIPFSLVGRGYLRELLRSISMERRSASRAQHTLDLETGACMNSHIDGYELSNFDSHSPLILTASLCPAAFLCNHGRIQTSLTAKTCFCLMKPAALKRSK